MRVLHLTTEFPPVIWGGLGTAVGGLVLASARAAVTVGVLLVGGVLVADGRYGGWQPVAPKDLPFGLGRAVVTADGVTFFHVTPTRRSRPGSASPARGDRP